MPDYEPLITDDRKYYGIPDYEGVLNALRRYSFWEFSGTDGCLCAHATIRGVELHVHCRKSAGGIPGAYGFYGNVVRVECHYLDSGRAALVDIGREMANQVLELNGHLPVIVRFCSWAQDDQIKCCYCGKPRSDPKGYLCDSCMTGMDPFGYPIRNSYTLPSDWSEIFEPTDEAD